MKSTRRLVAAACLVLLCVAAQAGAQTIWGTSTATLSDDPEFEGYWQYCLDIEWDTTGVGGSGMSHVSFFLGLGTCVCACDEGYFAFADTAGSGPGVGGCTVYYYGLFECYGDPTIPESDGPTVMFEAYDAACEPDAIGTAHLCFYSIFPPTEPGTFIDALGVKAGGETDVGELVGVLPLCECGSPVDDFSWGVIKSLYR